MTKEEMRLLYDFDKWATNQQNSVVSTLSTEQYQRNLHSSHGSIHKTLVHIFAAQKIWLERWKGSNPTALASPEETPNLESLMDRWNALRGEINEFLLPLSEEKLNAPLAFKNLKGEPSSLPLWQQMQHVVNHSTYHRGQITTMLRQLDVTPVATDLIAYYRLL